MSLARAAPVERGAMLLEPVRRLTAVPVTDAMTGVVLGQAAIALGMFDLGHRLYSSAIPTLRRQARPLLLAQALAEQAWASVHLGYISSRLPVAPDARDLVEAAMQSGHEQEAGDAIATLEPVAAQSRSPVLEIGLRFARALVASDAEAEALFQAGISDDTSLPLMVARSQLAYGLWLRRQRRICETPGPFRAARDSFQAMGFPPYDQLARRR